MELISIQGKSYAVGLYWQTLPGVTPLARAAREDAQKLKESTQGKTSYNAVVLRTALRQAGYAEVLGAIKPAPSLAAALAESPLLVKSKSEGWIMRLRIPGDQMLVMASIGGVVLPEGDFIGPEEHALRIMNNLKERYGAQLSEIIEDDSEESSISRLSEWLSAPGKRPPAKLRPLKNRAVVPLLGVGVAVLVLVFVGGHYLFSYITSSRLQSIARSAAAARARMQAKMEIQERETALNAALGPSVMPVEDFIASCYDAFARENLAKNGWILQEWLCNGQAITTIWKIAPGASMLSPPDNAVIDPKTTGTVTGSRVINPSPVLSKMALGHNKNAANGEFFNMARQVAADTVSIQWLASPALAPNKPKEPLPQEPAKANWSFTLPQISPFGIMGSLAAVHGLVIKQIIFKSTAGTYVWQIEGSLYASH